jgi:hypothetical protein|tara:strand:- start:2177 stop:3154 length:978 start_codon:yes stop_codon:yes gene_type:complete
MPEGQKTVDIDTSGPDTEIELENSNTETDNIEISNETTTEDSVESKDSPEKSNEQSDVQTDEPKNKEEVEQYSDGVQKRISKLTKKWREAERQKDEALTYAERVMAAKKQTDDKMSRYEPLFFKNTEESIKNGLDAAKAKLLAARDAGDITAEVEAQTMISELGYKNARFAETKSQQEEYNKKREMQVKTPDINLARQPMAQGNPDPKAENWASKNSWFGQDNAMTYTAFDLHKKLTDEEGFDPTSDEYYSEIDKRIRLEFPQKFVNNSNTVETTKPVQNVASARRSTKTGRRTVRLTSSQVAIAKKLGVPLEEYAKQLNITKEA